MDLTIIRERVQRKYPHLDANSLEIKYREFFLNRGIGRVDFEIDLFWHEHILDTLKYKNDCELTFGKFLHHIPDEGYCASAIDGG